MRTEDVESLFDYGDPDRTATVEVIVGSVAGIPRISDDDVADFLYPFYYIDGTRVRSPWVSNPAAADVIIEVAKGLANSTPASITEVNVTDQGDLRFLANYASAGLIAIGFIEVPREGSALPRGGLGALALRAIRQARSERSAIGDGVVQSVSSLAHMLYLRFTQGPSIAPYTFGRISAAIAEVFVSWAGTQRPAIVAFIKRMARELYNTAIEDGSWLTGLFQSRGVLTTETPWMTKDYVRNDAGQAQVRGIKEAFALRLVPFSTMYTIEDRRLVRRQADMTFEPGGETNDPTGLSGGTTPAGGTGQDGQRPGAPGGEGGGGRPEDVNFQPHPSGGPDTERSGDQGQRQDIGPDRDSRNPGDSDTDRNLLEAAGIVGLTPRHFKRWLTLMVELGFLKNGDMGTAEQPDNYT